MEPLETQTPRRRRLPIELATIGVVLAVLLGALGFGGAALYRDLYGPSAFVERYLSLLAEGRAADALRVPGVALDGATLSDSGIEMAASEALLRRSALAPLSGIRVTSEKSDDDTTKVKVSYVAGRHKGNTTFAVEQDGWLGIVPQWRFATSPLAAISLTVRGSDQFAVNDFEIDRRQVSSAGMDADPLAPVTLLVFTPGVYSVTVDTKISTSPGVSVLSDKPLATTPVDLQTEPTPEFIKIVQQRVQEFLAECTAQEVLQPTGCPFGLAVSNRISSLPKWSILKNPEISVVPDGASWLIPTADATAHIEVDVQSLYDGSIRPVAEEVPFQINGTIEILQDGSASILVGSPAR